MSKILKKYLFLICSVGGQIFMKSNNFFGKVAWNVLLQRNINKYTTILKFAWSVPTPTRGGYTKKVGCICWYSFVMAYFKQLCKKKLLVFVKICPPTGQIKKKVNFQDFAHSHYLLSLPYDHFQNTYWQLVFTDLLVTTLWVCEHPTYL